VTPLGALDPSFGTGGTVNLDVAGGNDVYRRVVVQPDGKIIVAGRGTVAGNLDFAVIRLNSDGSPDTSFGIGGTRTIPVLAGDDLLASVALQPDGRIVVAGHVSNGVDYDVGIARLRPDGSLDTSFNGTGIRVVQVSIGESDVLGQNGLTFGVDGDIVVAGAAQNGSELLDAMLIRLDGSPVNDFATGSFDFVPTGANLFGSCLQSHAGAGTSPTWAVDGNADCTAAVGDPWNAIAAGPADAGAKIAASTNSGSTSSTVSLRFGVRTAAAQTPGSYMAPVVFETIAPNA
jgi:uncharacterized delta-60 repeat protein